MKKIGGNVYAVLQIKITGTKNAIGEIIPEWVDCTALLGWLDLSSGDSGRLNFNAKIQESTHLFLCDFTSLENLSTGWVWDPFNFLTGVISEDSEDGQVIEIANAENARIVIDGMVYEIQLIDDPMGMHQHMEIYLKFTGGQNGS